VIWQAVSLPSKAAGQAAFFCADAVADRLTFSVAWPWRHVSHKFNRAV
jgi:hypothetical protein